MKPEISIIVPIYNVQEYLSKCIDSILLQTFSDLEIILVNDGSTDCSGDICDKYAEKDTRIRVLHKQNGGVSSARNAGLKLARGEYIGFVDPDDWIYKDMFMKLYNLSKEHNSDISVCGFCREIDGVITEQQKDIENIIQMNKIESMNELFKGKLYRFSLCNKLFKKQCFQDVEFPEGMIHEDLATTYKLFNNSNKVSYTNYIGYVYVKRHNSILNTKFNKNRLYSLEIWEDILIFMEKNYYELYDVVISCFTYWCIDNVYRILNQLTEDKLEYLNIVQKHIRVNYKSIVVNKLLSKKYKILCSVLSINTKLIILISKLRRIY